MVGDVTAIEGGDRRRRDVVQFAAAFQQYDCRFVPLFEPRQQTPESLGPGFTGDAHIDTAQLGEIFTGLAAVGDSHGEFGSTAVEGLEKRREAAVSTALGAGEGNRGLAMSGASRQRRGPAGEGKRHRCGLPRRLVQR